ncbi:hypothetical protein ABIE27_006082, partial [Paenibacillus sp. 4624]
SADGTWTAGSWESRTPPSKEPLPMMFGGGFYIFNKLVKNIKTFNQGILKLH